MAVMNDFQQTFQANLTFNTSNSITNALNNCRIAFDYTKTMTSHKTAATCAIFAGFLYLGLQMETAKTQFQSVILEQLKSTLNLNGAQFTKQKRKANRLLQLATILGRGGATSIAFYLTIQDLENINQEDWGTFLRRLRNRNELITYRNTITLLQSRTLPSYIQ